MTQRTYGIFATSIKGIAIKDDRGNGWVADLKQQFSRNAKPERLLTLDNIAVVKNAARDGGEIKLEVTPMLDGEALPAVLMPVTLRGNIAIDEDGAVTCTTRVPFDMLELSGLGIDALLSSSLCLECKVSDQPTLEESIQQELRDPAVLEGQEPIFPPAETEVRPSPETEETPAEFLARCNAGQLSMLMEAAGYDVTDWDDPKRSNDEDMAEWRDLLAHNWERVENTAGMVQVRNQLSDPLSIQAEAANHHQPASLSPDDLFEGDDMPFGPTSAAD